MSHIRDGGSSAGALEGGAVRDPTSPTDSPGVLLLDQCLPPDNQCRFILKPNRALLGQAPLMGETDGVKHIIDRNRFISQLKSFAWGILIVDS